MRISFSFYLYLPLHDWFLTHHIYGTKLLEQQAVDNQQSCCFEKQCMCRGLLKDPFTAIKLKA